MQWLFNLLNWYKQYKLDMIAAKAAVTNKPIDAMIEIVNKQSHFMQSWLDQFKVSDIPTTTVVRSEDEYNDEIERERFGGLDRGLRESINNAVKAGALPDLASIIGDNH